MTDVLERIRLARESGDLSELTDAIPYAQFLGISVDTSSGELIGKLAYQPMLVGNPTLPALHGGTLGALLESTAIFHLLWEAETVGIPKTITITVDYLRTGRTLDTFCRGTFTRLGRRVANVRVEAWQDDRDRPIATANAHFLLQPAPE